MMIIHIMLDLETWGTRPGFDLRSIGACVFDPITGEVSIPCRTCKGGTTRGNINDGGDCSDCMNTRMEQGYGTTFYIATDNPITGYDEAGEPLFKYRLNRDPSTVQWWSEQSDEAQAAFANPMNLRHALNNFSAWFYNVIDNGRSSVRLWSHGSAFDPPILAEAYHAVGLPVPWHYRAPRDTRTLFDAAGISDDGDGSYRTWMNSHNIGTHHNALDDAIAQARCVCEAYAMVARWRRA